jgi:large subunit ribosomal protein L5
MYIEKVTANIGVGVSGEKLEKAKKLLEKMTGQKAIETKSKVRVPAWNIRPGLPIGTKVTLRGKKANEFLGKCFEAVDKKIKEKSIDALGNFSFGVSEYIDIPGIKYDPAIGIYGFDVCVTVGKEGYRTSRRKRRTKKVPLSHKVTKNDTVNFLREKFGVEVVA